MRAVVVREHGGPEALRHEDLPDPSMHDRAVRVTVKACGINHLDVWVRRGVPGARFPLPIIPGSDVAGTVVEVGGAVDDVAKGDPVIVAPGASCGRCRACASGRDHHCRQYQILGEGRDGGCAEQIVVDRVNILPKPPELSFEEAAAIGIPFLTAWHMVVARAVVKPGETVLVQAAGSGVGSAAIQIAKLWGARVIATAGTDAKLAQAHEIGADDTLNYTRADIPREVKKLTAGRGADVVIDHVGTATFAQSLRALTWQGRFVTCGATTGADANLNLQHLFFKSLSVLGSTMGSRGELLEILEHVDAGRLRPVLARSLPLGDIAEAHRLLEERTVFGKVVVIP